MPAVAHPPDQPARRHHRQPEDLKPVPRVRAHRLPGQRPQLAGRRLNADHPAQVALKHPDPRLRRRQARSAANLKPRRAQDSGRRHTTDQPRPYPASVSLSFTPGTCHLLKRTPGQPVRLRTATFIIAAA